MGGWTGYHYACEEGHLEVVKAILEGGKELFDANVLNDDGETGLDVAARSAH